MESGSADSPIPLRIRSLTSSCAFVAVLSSGGWFRTASGIVNEREGACRQWSLSSLLAHYNVRSARRVCANVSGRALCGGVVWTWKASPHLAPQRAPWNRHAHHGLSAVVRSGEVYGSACWKRVSGVVLFVKVEQGVPVSNLHLFKRRRSLGGSTYDHNASK
eukprot:6183481-Pleurochrysis_carterae.AAC.2